MRNVGQRIAIALIGLVALACASSSELTRRSEVAYGKHDYERAYKEARAALEKNAGNGHARLALSAAAMHLIDEREQRILNLAASDTLQAAEGCLELVDFRAQALRYGATLPSDSSFATKAQQIRRNAAGRAYREALASLKQDQPKLAYKQLLIARRYVPGYRDIDTRIPRVWERAVTRIAIVPFDNETGVPGLSRSITDRIYEELAPRVQSKAFEFTELVPASAVYGALNSGQIGDLSRAEAIDVGRYLGAKQVVFGRFRGLNTHSDTDHYHGVIWRKFTERDTAGRTIERYADIPFDAVQRSREVDLRVEFEVIDVMSEEPVAQKSRDVDATARTVYTSYVPEGNCEGYCLVPPSLKAKDPERCERIEQDWSGTFRSWTVPKLLARARRDHSRTRYRSDYRTDFIGLDPDYPVFLDDIPSPDELVYIALDDSWNGVFTTLKELDPRD